LFAKLLIFSVLVMVANIASIGWSKEADYIYKGFGLSIATEKAIYHPGEPITITLIIFNYTEDTVTFTFTSSKRYDFTIRREKKEIWCWSAEKLFAQVMGKERIEPGERLSYTETYSSKAKLTPGIYSVTGMLTCKDLVEPMRATIHIKIVEKEEVTS